MPTGLYGMKGQKPMVRCSASGYSSSEGFMDFQDSILQDIKKITGSKVKTKKLVSELSKLLTPLATYKDTEISLQLLNDSLVEHKSKEGVDIAINYSVLKLMLSCQYAFYKLSNEQCDEVKDKYSFLCESCVDIYEGMMQGAKERLGADAEAMYSLTFQVDPSKPLASNLREFDKFVEAARVTIKTTYETMQKVFEGILIEKQEKGLMPFWIFHRDIVGCGVEWKKTIKWWLECYYVYGVYLELNKKKAQLVRHLSGVDIFSHLYLTEVDMANSIHKVDKYIVEAERLIASAQAGTFPV